MIELKTIGYEGLSLDQFLGILERCEVSLLLDIRELPISRKRGFSKTALKQALESRGISYEHLADLGSPRDIRHDYRDDGDWATFERLYKEHLEKQDEALGQLVERMKNESCCLLCFEEDYNGCHRSIVADRVRQMAGDTVRIQHLTGPITGRVVEPDLVPA